MFIRSERLFLRPGWPEERPELHALLADEAIVGNLATLPWPLAEARCEGAPRDRRLPHFLITLPGADGARLVGSIGLGIDDGDVELGYWIARPYWGQGYATEAARAVITQARAIGHRRLVATHFLENPASGRVLQKVGFRPAGEVRQRYSMGRDEIAPALRYALCLGEPGDCGDDEPAMRAA